MMKKYLFILLLIIQILCSCTKSTYLESLISKDVCIDKSGKEYKTINIAGQLWMAENLAYLPQIDKEYTNSMDQALFYVYGYNGLNIKEAQTENNYITYGVLYNKEAALIACPNGWHLPSDAEWKNLEQALGMPADQLDDINNRGNETISIKSRSIELWKTNNGTNENGFNVFPAGYKDTESFKNLGVSSTFWTRTEYNEQITWIREFSYIRPGIKRIPVSKQSAYSVRCIKDN